MKIILEPPEEKRLKKTPEILIKNFSDSILVLLLEAWVATRMLPKSLTPPGYHKAKGHADFGNLPSELLQGLHPAEQKPYYKHKHSIDMSSKFWGAEPVRKGPHMVEAAVYPATELHLLS